MNSPNVLVKVAVCAPPLTERPLFKDKITSLILVHLRLKSVFYFVIITLVHKNR